MSILDRVKKRLPEADPNLLEEYAKTMQDRLCIRLGEIMRCDSDSGKKLIKSMVLRTADRQGMC